MPDSVQANRSYPLLASIGVTVAVAAFLLTLFSFYIHDRQDVLADSLFTVLAEVNDDVFGALFSLSNRNYTSCNDENLREMEAALFNSLYPKQIMFYVNDVGVCSTGSGQLSTPVRRPPPDFYSEITGAEIWVNREIILDLTGEPFTAIIIKLGDYSAMVDPAVLALRDSAPFDWQFLFRDTEIPERYAHIYGSEGLYRPLESVHTVSNNSLLYFERCDADRPYLCLVLASTVGDIATEYAEVIALLTMLSLALGNIAGNQVVNYQLRQIEITTRLIRGFKAESYFWHYQPIVDMENSRIVGCEVLSRFSDHYGNAFPNDYLPALRKAGLTAKFTRLMFSTILAELEQIPALPDGFKISVNIFPADIISGAINDIVTMPEIRQTRFNITLEITEEQYLDEIGGQDSLEAIHEAGLAISIDDFGTGYSNLKQLKKIKCSYLKIDRSYIADLEEEPIKSSLIPHIVNMAEQLGLEVIAEGIETFEQEIILVGLGIRFGQGGYFGAPMAAADLAGLIEARKRGRSGIAVIIDD